MDTECPGGYPAWWHIFRWQPSRDIYHTANFLLRIISETRLGKKTLFRDVYNLFVFYPEKE